MFHLVFVTETVLQSTHTMLQMLREIGHVSGHFNFLSEVKSDVHMQVKNEWFARVAHQWLHDQVHKQYYNNKSCICFKNHS